MRNDELRNDGLWNDLGKGNGSMRRVQKKTIFGVLGSLKHMRILSKEEC